MSTPPTLPRPPAAVAGTLALLAALAAAIGALALWQAPHMQWQAPAPARLLQAGIAIVLYVACCAALLLPRREQMQRSADPPQPPAGNASGSLLVAHASQTGYADMLAGQMATALAGAGMTVRQLELASLDAAALSAASRILFVVSTTGEGDAPDSAARFVSQVMTTPLQLEHLEYGLLALGDSSYDDYCGFGHALDHWLRGHGARPLFDLIEVDDGDDGALRHWQHHLRGLSGQELPDWQAPRYQDWTLARRTLANPGSVGGACFQLELQPPPGTALTWRAGDIAEVGPRQAPADVCALLQALALDGATEVDAGHGREPLAAVLARSHLPEADALRGLDAQALALALRPLPHREYSIASLPADGGVHLLVRRMQRSDGRPGLGSGWLCAHAEPGQTIALRIRGNPNFHMAEGAMPLILIGNGTGIAGLRALLKARIQAGQRSNWLLFGERNADCDFHYRQDIEQWQQQGFIARLDIAFSRDQKERIHVQQRLRESAAILRAWVDEGAMIHVCGSLQGMASGVDAALREVLGPPVLEQLTQAGRYRRDVY